MSLRDFIAKKDFIILDGALGTTVMKKYPQNYDALELFSFNDEELIRDIHKSYVAAGSDIIITNTFSANRFKLEKFGKTVGETVKKAVSIAKSAGAKFVGLDIGPLGKLLEPLGSLSFDDAYDAFKEIVEAGAACGVDLIYFETFSDLLELKAGILAAKENCGLPVFATMTFELNGRTFTGVSPSAAAVTAEGLGVDAFGLNCSSGPDKMLPIVEEIASVINLPIIAKANAGIPEFKDGVSVYGMTPQKYIESLDKLIDAGATFVGGCCGTDASYIEAIKALLKSKAKPVRAAVKKTVAASQSKIVVIDDSFTIIGERLNPTGKPLLKKALIEKNFEYLIAEGREQLKAGADIIDINAGLFEIDEAEVLSLIVKSFNGIVDAPFCLDSSGKQALERAARYVSGLPLINSVNGKTSNIKAILPIAKKYGAPIVCLLLDEAGIPKTVEDRIRIAEKIIAAAREYGIEKEKLIFDCLTLTASAEQANVVNTLKAVKIINEKYGCKTVLGLSNVSFGLPCRGQINSAFLSHALAHGLTAAILNPLNDDVTGAVDSYRVLYNKDKNAESYIAKYKDRRDGPKTTVAPACNKGGGAVSREAVDPLIEAIIKGQSGLTGELSRRYLESADGLTVINKYLIPALDIMGALYERGEVFLPELLAAANAAKAAFDAVKEKNPKSAESKGTVLLATVFGDVHDIGKNIAKMLLNNYGYDVIDLGKDVPTDAIISAIKQNDIKLVGLSALMTTTLNNMRDAIAEIRKVSDAKIMVGGAVVTKENSKLIGADFYCKDAIDGVGVARKLLL
ncbi:MAG: homocysteine S-methyltransferase family protein [Clostridiales bacterium]|jgi:5-methyltetrahydrofolate--homocysteine methyltransferase|nr:homocysteine S-methyltransferase family protein [Clostridiales bacterium]